MSVSPKAKRKKEMTRKEVMGINSHFWPTNSISREIRSNLVLQ
jgi:hypothetical protein